MTKQLYAVNKSGNHLQLKRGFFHIPRDGYKPISEEDTKHPDFVYAKDKNWIEFTDVEPTRDPTEAAIQAIETVAPLRGLTAAELKAQQENEVKAPAAKSAAIGASTESEDPEGSDDTKAETTAVPAKSKGRKAAAEKPEKTAE